MINYTIGIGGGSTTFTTPSTHFSTWGDCTVSYVGECSGTKNIVCDEIADSAKTIEGSGKSLSSPVDLTADTPPKSAILTERAA